MYKLIVDGRECAREYRTITAAKEEAEYRFEYLNAFEVTIMRGEKKLQRKMYDSKKWLHFV